MYCYMSTVSKDIDDLIRNITLSRFPDRLCCVTDIQKCFIIDLLTLLSQNPLYKLNKTTIIASPLVGLVWLNYSTNDYNNIFLRINPDMTVGLSFFNKGKCKYLSPTSDIKMLAIAVKATINLLK